MVFYHEYEGMAWTQLSLFGLGVCVTVCGVYILSDYPSEDVSRLLAAAGAGAGGAVDGLTTDAMETGAGAGDKPHRSLGTGADVHTLLGADHDHDRRSAPPRPRPSKLATTSAGSAGAATRALHEDEGNTTLSPSSHGALSAEATRAAAAVARVLHEPTTSAPPPTTSSSSAASNTPRQRAAQPRLPASLGHAHGGVTSSGNGPVMMSDASALREHAHADTADPLAVAIDVVTRPVPSRTPVLAPISTPAGVDAADVALLSGGHTPTTGPAVAPPAAVPAPSATVTVS